MSKTFKKGDVVRCLDNAEGQFTKDKLYIVREDWSGRGFVGILEDDSGSLTNGWSSDDFELAYPPEFIVAVRDRISACPSYKPYVHKHRNEADAEAKRLAEQHVGTEFAVYERVGAFLAEKPVAKAIP